MSRLISKVRCHQTMLVKCRSCQPLSFVLYSVSSHCSQCELASNLWLCLTCGSVNCGRQQFGGIGGNGHALEHYKQTGHGVGVKLGTVTPEGTGGEMYCSEIWTVLLLTATLAIQTFTVTLVTTRNSTSTSPSIFSISS